MSKKILNTVATLRSLPLLPLSLPCRAERFCKSPAVKTNSRASRKKRYQTALAQITLLINHLLTGSDVASCERHPKAKALLTPPDVSGHTLTHAQTHTHAQKEHTVEHTYRETCMHPCTKTLLRGLRYMCAYRWLSGFFGLLPDCSSQTKFGL